MDKSFLLDQTLKIIAEQNILQIASLFISYDDIWRTWTIEELNVVNNAFKLFLDKNTKA